MKTADHEDAWHIPQTVKQTANEDGAVLLDVDRGICFSLNPVGLEIWTLLQAGSSRQEIVKQLGDRYKISHEQIATDVDDFLDSLERSKLAVRGETDKDNAGFWRRILRRH